MLTGEREALEGFYTHRRIVELEFDPVRGSFDFAHLQEINRRIFQDLPGAGFSDVHPGEFRSPTPKGRDWMKHRMLSTVKGSFYVAYSSLDSAAQARLNKAMVAANPLHLRGVAMPEFTACMGQLYVELDYAHPFSDGNSRTLRTFTKQWAQACGYVLDWGRFAASAVGRDVLYIGRDLSVNAMAKPLIQDAQTMQKIVYSMDRLQGNRDLPDLLRDAIRASQ